LIPSFDPFFVLLDKKMILNSLAVKLLYSNNRLIFPGRFT
jgi:hypothetical protein